MITPLEHNKGVGFKYTVTIEQMEKHAALPLEEVFKWIEEMHLFFLEIQTPEERERMYLFKPNKRPRPDLM